MTGNLGTNQAQALQPILRGEKATNYNNNNNNKKGNYSEWCRRRMIADVQS